MTLIEQVQALLDPLAVGGAWYAVNTAEPPVYPYIVWNRSPSAANVTLRGPTDLQSTNVQIDIYSRLVSELDLIGKALDAAFAAWSVQNIPTLSFDLPDPPTKSFRTVKEYSIWSIS